MQGRLSEFSWYAKNMFLCFARYMYFLHFCFWNKNFKWRTRTTYVDTCCKRNFDSRNIFRSVETIGLERLSAFWAKFNAKNSEILGGFHLSFQNGFDHRGLKPIEGAWHHIPRALGPS